MGSSRRLAAIMFTDITGYTAMMQRSESKAIHAASRHRQVLEDHVPAHGGEILNYYGDGSLSVFTSTADALHCALRVQLDLQDEPKVPLRIGLHLGEILRDDDTVFGDGVNIASRIEALGSPGSILISRNIFEQIRNQQDFKVQLLGSFHLKNVIDPVDVYALIHTDLPSPKVGAKRESPEDNGHVSIAVLPFTNISDDASQEYFCDGICEELINALSRVDGLRVTARSSSFLFKDTRTDIRDIGRRLGVNMILEGSVRKSDDRVRISARLIKVVEMFNLWSGQYERTIENVFEIQNDIARAIVTALRVKLNLGKNEQIVRQETYDLKAYDLYLQAKFFYNKKRHEDNLRAIAFLEKSIEHDPHFALGHATLALAYIEQFFSHQPSPQWEQKAYLSLRKAKSLNPEIPEIYVATGNLLWTRTNGFPHIDALKQHRRAVSLNPNLADAYSEIGRILWHIGMLDEAAAAFETAVDIDPLFIGGKFRLGWLQIHRSNFREALSLLSSVPKESLRMSVYTLRAKCHWYLGEYDKALMHLGAIPPDLDMDPEVSSTRAIFRAIEDKPDEVEQLVKQSIEKGQNLGHYHHVTHNFAQAYAQLGNVQKAVQWLRFTVNDGFPCYPWIAEDPLFEKIRSDSRFTKFLSGLKKIWKKHVQRSGLLLKAEV